MNEFSIAGRSICYNHKPLIIAELGINHGGSLNSAFKIVDAAVAAGAAAVAEAPAMHPRPGRRLDPTNAHHRIVRLRVPFGRLHLLPAEHAARAQGRAASEPRR